MGRMVKDGHSFTVLVIGCDEHLRDILLSRGISKIHQASSRDTIPPGLNNLPCDVVLLEWESVAGADFVWKARTNSILRCSAPIIAISDCTDGLQREIARDLGVSDFLTKPISAQDLFSSIEGALEQPRPFVYSESYCGPDRRRRAYHVDFGRHKSGHGDVAFVGNIAPWRARASR
jgi:two-component system, chemotaxis family, chemotaxis protein CheY